MLHLKQPEEALAAFRKALDKSPDLEAALLGQAAALHMSYELDDAERVYRSVLARNSESREALTNLVILGQQKKDDALVREHARKLLALDPDSEPALLALSNVSFAAGAFEAAAVHCARLVQLRPDQHDYWYNLGVAEERRGNLDASARAFENAASAEPSSAAAYLACAAVFEKMGDNAAARVSLGAHLASGSQRIDVSYHIALLAERQGLIQEAAALYESIVAEDPKHTGVALPSGLFETVSRRLPGSFRGLRSLPCGASPVARGGNQSRAGLLEAEPGGRGAGRARQTPLPANRVAWIALRGAAALSVAGAPALDNLQKLRDAGDRSPEVMFNSGLLHQQAGQWQEAISCYREALAANPKFADALVNLGHALMATGDPEGASESWAAAVELNPQLARGYY